MKYVYQRIDPRNKRITLCVVPIPSKYLAADNFNSFLDLAQEALSVLTNNMFCSFQPRIVYMRTTV
jgi:hypothetical protein